MGCWCFKIFNQKIDLQQQQIPNNKLNIPNTSLNKVPILNSNFPSMVRPQSTPMFNRVKVIQTILKKKERGKKMINDYQIGETIGQGLFGKVKKVTRLEQGQIKTYAMKILSKALMSKRKIYYKDKNGVLQTKDGFEYLQREFAVYKKIRHKNLIRLFQVLTNQQNEKIYFIIELAQKGQLIKWDDIKNTWNFADKNSKLISQQQLRKICRGCIKAIYHLHQNNIIHRDLKPQNILFNKQYEVKISDFGISLLCSHVKVNQLKGTDYFLAPQCFQEQKTKELDGRAIDIWGLGVSLYSFYFLKLPFFDEDFDNLVNIIKTEKVTYKRKQENEQELNQVSLDLIIFFQKIFQKNPDNRINIKQLVENEWVNFNSPSLIQQIKNQIIQVNSADLTSQINIISKLTNISDQLHSTSHTNRIANTFFTSPTLNSQHNKQSSHVIASKEVFPGSNHCPESRLEKIVQQQQSNNPTTQRALLNVWETPGKKLMRFQTQTTSIEKFQSPMEKSG